MLAENSTKKDAEFLKNRIALLANKDVKMQRKVEETRRKAEKMKQVKQFS